MTTPAGHFDLHIEQVDDFEFRVRFDKDTYAELTLDEPPPLGQDRGPNPARLLAAAIGDCLSASLLFCLKRAGVTLTDLKSDVHVEMVRNEEKRLRVGKVDVVIRPGVAADDAALHKCLGTFEDFCVVTQSVRAGVDVNVKVEPTG